jgi:hypothetical protein
VTDQALLAKIASEAKDSRVREAVAERASDQALRATNKTASPNPNAPNLSVVTVWRDARDALMALFVPALIAFLIMLASVIVWRIIPVTGNTFGGQLEILSYGAVTLFLLTPYLIAVHRFIILGEKTTSYRIVPTEPRFRRFFGWLLVLSALLYAPVLATLLFKSISSVLVIFAFVPLIAFGILLPIRTIVLFPAVAVDAPGANWGQAVADTKGHAGRIFSTMVGAILPLAIVHGVLNLIPSMAPAMLLAFLATTIKLFNYTLSSSRRGFTN